MGTSSDGEQQTGLYIKIGVVALALVGACFFAFRSNSGVKQLDTPESAVPYVCTACGNVLEVTPAGFDRLMKDSAGAGGNEERGRGLTLKCPNCSKLAVVKAARCPKDKTAFPIRAQKGEPPKCPKCGWSPQA